MFQSFYETINVDNLRKFTKLRTLDGINMSALLLKGDEITHGRRANGTEQQAGAADPDHMVDMREVLPPVIESIRIKTERLGEIEHQHLQEELLRKIANLVEDERFAQLKEVCVWYLTAACGTTQDQTSDAFERIQVKGVDLHCTGSGGGVMDRGEHPGLHSDGGLAKVETEFRDPLDQW
ncbi:hypothetical protein LTR85_003052 [Meristemomyces frigidus]|nr:hypothetical protein LTR85_003052 [Meristemomyces frigidus]